MAIGISTEARELGVALGRAVRHEPLVQELWVTARLDGVHLWLIVEPATDEDERRLFSMLDVLDVQFPNADFQLHVLNPTSYTIDVHDVVPPDAARIALPAA